MTPTVDNILLVFNFHNVRKCQPHQRRLLVYSLYDVSSASSVFHTHRLHFRIPSLSLFVLYTRTLSLLSNLPASIHMAVHSSVYWHKDPPAVVVFVACSVALTGLIIPP